MPPWKATYRLSIIESDSARPTPDQASHALDSLAADRERLAGSTRTPWGLLAALGLASAWFVAQTAVSNPGGNYEPGTTWWLPLLAAALAGFLIRRETGIRFRRMGARATWLSVGILVVVLVLFSLSLGLVSFDLRWAVALTALAAFVATVWLGSMAFRAAVGTLRR